jgi:NAD(P)-dependent dehydrogenase (short-subunit alcohol dehydrogenase family)
VYSATKTAVRVISEGLRQEVKPYNIRTTVISPGAVSTELPNSITEPDVAEGVQKFYKEIANSGRIARAGSGLRDEPAGRGGHKRDPVPAHAPGAVEEIG